MGLFDSFVFTAQCPHCKQTAELEGQTKSLMCGFYRWRIGDEVGGGRLLASDGPVRCRGSHNCGPDSAWLPFSVTVHVEAGRFVGFDVPTQEMP